MIVFPQIGHSVDGMPHLSFVWDSLKDTTKKEEKVVDVLQKYSRKPRVDMGIPPPQHGTEN
jgi:hypothetical protein